MITIKQPSHTHWRKSTYSNGDGGSCLEVADRTWRKSSYSNSDGGSCLEVADGISDRIPVRDSKNPDGPVLLIPIRSWAAFVDRIKGTSL